MSYPDTLLIKLPLKLLLEYSTYSVQRVDLWNILPAFLNWHKHLIRHLGLFHFYLLQNMLNQTHSKLGRGTFVQKERGCLSEILDLWRLNTLRGTKTAFWLLKGTTNPTPSLSSVFFMWESPRILSRGWFDKPRDLIDYQPVTSMMPKTPAPFRWIHGMLIAWSSAIVCTSVARWFQW